MSTHLWDSLTESEKSVCIFRVFHSFTVDQTAARMEISRWMANKRLWCAYQKIGISNHCRSARRGQTIMRLALWMGLHIKEIDPDYQGEKQ